MAGEGENKVAASLIDLQPTAVLELFRVYPDRINKPTLFFGFHGGSLFDKALTWQNIQYLPLAVESEGFDLLGDGKLARPKIRVSNKNNIVTNFLQNYKDFVNAKIIRIRVSVRFLDDSNFDGGNPFGVADPNAELTNEEWIMGRKIQESKIFVEFELNSPLDLESFSVNPRAVVAKFCYWQYRGEGCRYQGLPVERDNGSPFLDPDGGAVVPKWPSSYTGPDVGVDFFNDPTAEWNSLRTYLKGDIVVISSPSISLPDPQNPDARIPLKTVYVCVSGNSEQSPEGNPSYWQKDGCTKKLPACQSRFNEWDGLAFIESQNIPSGFSGIRLSGAQSSDGYAGPTNSGLFHSTVSGLTGALTGSFTLVGWANMTSLSPLGAGLFSTSSRDDGKWPISRYINIGAKTIPASVGQAATTTLPGSHGNFDISANYIGTQLPDAFEFPINPDYAVGGLPSMTDVLGGQQWQGTTRDWNQYTIIHDTKTQSVLDEIARPEVPDTLEGLPSKDTMIAFYVNNEKVGGRRVEAAEVEPNGNFASVEKRQAITWGGDAAAGGTDEDSKALPQTFMLGGVENRYGTWGYELGSKEYVSTMNGALGQWALWGRVLTEDELEFLYRFVTPPNEVTNGMEYVPRPYGECTGRFEDLTGDRLIAWWDGSTGEIPSTTTLGMLDIHTNGYHLTGSGQFSGFEESYVEAPVTIIENFTPVYPRYGGYPGTDGFNYGRDTTIY